ncbi:MAG: GNAT family N-acetyltransferase [Succinivibrionaceae bacterium]
MFLHHRNLIFIDISNFIYVDVVQNFLNLFPNFLFFAKKRILSSNNNTIPLNNIPQYLGTTNTGIILDSTDFNADYCLSVLGSISSFGFILCLIDKNNLTEEYFNYFKNLAIKYRIKFIPFNLFLSNNLVTKITNIHNKILLKTKFSENHPLNLLTPTKQQLYFINNTYEQLCAQNSIHYLLTGKRGSGKTCTIYFLLKKLNSLNLSIGILSPTKNKISFINNLNIQQNIKFITLENANEYIHTINLLIIDEAATIPLFHLHDIIKNFSSVIISTTMDCYEGSGNGLRIINSNKFTIYNLTNSFRNYYDKISVFFDKLTFYQQYINKISTFIYTKHSHPFISFSKFQSLLKDTNTLVEINNILKLNHYQFTRNNIIRWLQNPNVYIGLLKFNSISGLIIFTKESINDPNLALDIFNGIRQPHDNLIPQTLLAHLGDITAHDYTYFRIERIAIIPELRKQGYGKMLISECEKFLVSSNMDIDYLAVSCANNLSNSLFWPKNNFYFVNIGITKDNASGLESICLLKPLNKNSLSHLSTILFLFTAKTNDLFKRYQINNEGYIKQIISNYDPPSKIGYFKDIIKSIAYHHHNIEHSYSYIKQYLKNNLFFKANIKKFPYLSTYIKTNSLTQAINLSNANSKKNMFIKIRSELIDVYENSNN